MEVVLLIALFVLTAIALNFLVADKQKLAGTCMIINLCLIIALAYQLALISQIMMVVIGAIVVVLVAFVVMHKRNNKKNDIINDQIEVKGE